MEQCVTPQAPGETQRELGHFMVRQQMKAVIGRY